jgi:hypothetical protein
VSPSNSKTIKQQDHAMWKGKLASTNLQGQGTASDEETESNDASFVKITQSLASNYYACISPPLCQVKEYKPNNSPVIPQPKILPEIANKITQQWRGWSNKQQD